MGRDRGRGRGGKSEAAAARERVRALEERLRQLQQTQQTMQQQQQQQAPQTPYYPAYTPHPPSYGPQQPVNNYYFGAGGMTQPQAPYVPPPSAFAPVQAPNPAFSALPAPNQLPAQYAQPQQGFVGSTYSFNFPPQVHAQQAYPAYAQTPSPLAYCQQQAPAVPATQQALPGPPSSASTKKGGKGKSANTDLLAPVNASAKIGKKVGSKKLTEREKMQKFGAAYKTPEQLAELKKAKKVRSQTQEVSDRQCISFRLSTSCPEPWMYVSCTTP